MFWAERGLVPYKHPSRQIQGVWNRYDRKTLFWFPIDNVIAPQIAERAGILANIFNKPNDVKTEVDVINPNFVDTTCPAPSTESGQRLVIVSTSMQNRLGPTAHKKIAEMELAAGEPYPTHEQLYVRRAVDELGVLATSILEVYNPFIFKYQLGTSA